MHFGDRKMSRALIEKMLKKQDNACYVLITCAEPSQEGEMEVEFTYEGDTDLAGYLIENAHTVINSEVAEG